MRRLTLALALLAALVARLPEARAADRLEATVVWIDDGDTIDVRVGDRLERVRYIGIDAPEVPHHGEGGTPGGEAATVVNRALVAGKHVTLELDAEARDRYGRLLAYVWVDGAMANLAMVQRGYARTLTIPPNVRYARSFADAERDAREAGRGLWRDGAFGSGDVTSALSLSRLPRAHRETARAAHHVHAALPVTPGHVRVVPAVHRSRSPSLRAHVAARRVAARKG